MTKKADLFHHLRHQASDNKLADQLFPGSQWYTYGVLDLRPKTVTRAAPAPAAKTEKSQTIESLKVFAQTQIEDSEDAKIVFPGGEIALKEGAALGKRLTLKRDSNPPAWADRTVKVIFYGEASKLGKEQDDTRASELLDKMVAAMQLPESAVIKLLDAQDLKLDDLLAGIFACRPEFVVTLGAGATNALLVRQEKLTRIHGQFFPVTLVKDTDEHVTKLMPLFHPDYLLINPNMKRTAWIDLQKIMSELGIANA